MAIDKKTEKPDDEKEWEDPLNPEKPSDNRDREKIARQYREAKRRHDNLSENQDDEKDKKETK